MTGLRENVQARVGQYALEEVARLAAARVLLAHDHQHRHAQLGDARLVRIQRRAPRLHSAHGIGMPQRRHGEQLLGKAVVLGGIALLQAPAVRARVHLRGERRHAAGFDQLRRRLGDLRENAAGSSDPEPMPTSVSERQRRGMPQCELQRRSGAHRHADEVRLGRCPGRRAPSAMSSTALSCEYAATAAGTPDGG